MEYKRFQKKKQIGRSRFHWFNKLLPKICCVLCVLKLLVFGGYLMHFFLNALSITITLSGNFFKILSHSSKTGSPIKAPCAFICDEAYPLLKKILKPNARKKLGEEQEIFNKTLSRERKTIGSSFGILTMKWKICTLQSYRNRS